MDDDERRKIQQAWESARRAPVKIRIPTPRYGWIHEQEMLRRRSHDRLIHRYAILSGVILLPIIASLIRAYLAS